MVVTGNRDRESLGSLYSLSFIVRVNLWSPAWLFMSVLPAIKMPRQEDSHELKAILGYKVRYVSQCKNKTVWQAPSNTRTQSHRFVSMALWFFLDVFVALSCSSFVSKEYGILLVTLSSYLGQSLWNRQFSCDNSFKCTVRSIGIYPLPQINS